MTTPTTPPTPDAPIPPEPSDLTPAADDRSADDLADEMFRGDGATTTATAPGIPAPATAPEPQWLSGPAPFALVLGLLGLLVAGSVLVGELTDITLPWGDLGPWSVVAAGLVILLVGAIGLRSSRSRDTRG